MIKYKKGESIYCIAIVSIAVVCFVAATIFTACSSSTKTNDPQENEYMAIRKAKMADITVENQEYYFPEDESRYAVVDATYDSSLRVYEYLFRDKINNTMYLMISKRLITSTMDDSTSSLTQLFNPDGTPMLWEEK